MLKSPAEREPAISQPLVIDGQPLTIAQLHEVVVGGRAIALSKDSDVRRRIETATALVEQAVNDRCSIYGITTGFGGMSDQPIPPAMAAASQQNLLTFLAAGAGPAIDERHVRAAMVLRANVLAQGCSGIRAELIDRLLLFVRRGATPLVRELGSIGASGDLVPLAAVARAVTGQAKSVRVRYRGREWDGPSVLGELGCEPVELRPKEALALVNGTSFSAAIAANCMFEARSQWGLLLATQAMMLRSLQANAEPFESFVHQCKPHPGQVWVARLISRLLNGNQGRSGGAKRNGAMGTPSQDRYSIRCLPQYLGPVAEGLVRAARIVETEMNGVSDNPLIDVSSERFFQSGNFLGQYLGVAMDDLRRFIGLMAKHLDVQIALLATPEFSNGLPHSLRGNDRLPYNMGLKGLQITGNSIMPLLTYFGNPIVEHFPTHAEQFNQNINGLSWGSANLAWKAIELFRHYLSISLVFAVQALDLRAKLELGHFDGSALLNSSLEPLYSAVCRAMQVQPAQGAAFLHDDSDHWLEEKLALIFDDIKAGGETVAATKLIAKSFGQFESDHRELQS